MVRRFVNVGGDVGDVLQTSAGFTLKTVDTNAQSRPGSSGGHWLQVDWSSAAEARVEVLKAYLFFLLLVARFEWPARYTLLCICI